MHDKVYTHNSKISKHDRGNVICKKCNKQLSFIPDNDYKYLFLVFLCKCGTMASFLSYDFAYKKTSDDELYLDSNNDMATCSRCGKQLFYIPNNDYTRFSFRVICDCGKEFNLKLD